MPCGTYRYKMNWECRVGRLNRLNTQVKPNSTLDYGSLAARERLIRRRTSANIWTNPPFDPMIKGGNNRAWPNARAGVGPQYNGYQAYGPLFGEKRGVGSGPCACTPEAVAAEKTKGRIYRSNGGSSSDVVYWKRIHGGSIQLMPACWGCADPDPSHVTSSADFFRYLKCNMGSFPFEGEDLVPRSLQCANALISNYYPTLQEGYPRNQVRDALYHFGPFLADELPETFGGLGDLNNAGKIESVLCWPKETVTVPPSMRHAGGPPTNAGRYQSHGANECVPSFSLFPNAAAADDGPSVEDNPALAANPDLVPGQDFAERAFGSSTPYELVRERARNIISALRQNFAPM